MLLLPALIPSWRFFDSIAPSPRIEYVVFDQVDNIPDNWIEYRPKPQSLSLSQIAKRLIYNPARNEALFMASCAERLIKDEKEYGAHSTQEIKTRIEDDIGANLTDDQSKFLQFRLAFISRENDRIVKHIVHLSEVMKLKDGASS
jgi:hypothetical protein